MNLPKLTKEQGLLWGDSLVQDSKTLEQVNVRRLMTHIQQSLGAALAADLFVSGTLSHLKALQRKSVQEKIEEYRQYMERVLSEAKATGAVVDYFLHNKGMVSDWHQAKDGTMTYVWHDGTEQALADTKRKPRRKVRVLAKRACKTTLGFDTKLVMHKPVEHITLTVVLTKDGAEFK